MAADQFTWGALFTAALSGGIAVKALDVIYSEFRLHFDLRRVAKEFVSTHLDPILKSADEVVGKLRAYAERDFKEIEYLDPQNYRRSLYESGELSGFAYLLATFWARIEMFRREGLSYSIGSDKRGRRLSRFIAALESRGGRLVNRTTQRAIGEALILGGSDRPMSYIEFVDHYETDERFRHWLAPLIDSVCQCGNKQQRQRLLKFGVVLHAMVDTLDKKHHVTKIRPGYANKLTTETRRDLKFRVFDLHLPFVEDTRRYLTAAKKVGGPRGPAYAGLPLGSAFRWLRTEARMRESYQRARRLDIE